MTFLLGIDLDEKPESLAPDESELLDLYRKMDSDSRAALLVMARNSAALSGVGQKDGGRTAVGAVR